MTPDQERVLRAMCELYKVEFEPTHYAQLDGPTHPNTYGGWLRGWLGGPDRFNPYMYKELAGRQPTKRPTFYVFMDLEGGLHNW